MYKATKKAVKEDEVFKATSRATVDYAFAKGIQDRIKSGLETLNTDYTDLYTSYNSRFFDKDGNFTDSYGKTDNDSEYENYSQKAARLNNEIGEIQNYLKKYGNLYDGESLKNINAMLENASGGIKNMGQAYEFYSNFHTENDYNAYIMNNTADLENGMSAESIAARTKAYEANNVRMKEIEDILDKVGSSEIVTNDGLKGWLMKFTKEYDLNNDGVDQKALIDEYEYLQEQNRLYERYNKKNDSLVTQFADSADFKVNSVYVPQESKNGVYGGFYPDEYRTFLEYYNVGTDALVHSERVRKGIEPDDYWYSGQSRGWNYATEDEFNMLNFLANTQGDEAAQSYYEALSKDLTRRRSIAEEKKWDENYKNAKWYEKVGLNALSVLERQYGPILDAIEDLGNLVTGIEYDPYSASRKITNHSYNTRKNTAFEIDETTGGGEFLGVSPGDAYQAAMSGVDSVVGAATFKRAYQYIAGIGAASSKAKELYEQGASDGQIAAASILAGAAETLFESFSIGYFLDEFVNAPARKWYVNLLKSFGSRGIEMSEEMATSLSNTITDVMVLGSRSEWKKLITSYKEQGYSDSDAFVNAMWDKGGDILKDGIMGFISGGGTGSVGAVINMTNTNKAYDKFYKQTGGKIISADNIKPLVAKAKALDKTKTNAKVKALATELEGVDVSKLNAKEKTAFKKKAGQLYEAVLEAQNKQGKASFDTAKKNIIREQLNKKGITDEKEIEAATQAIMKVVYNKGALTAKESELLEKVGGNEIASYLINNAAEVTTEGIVTALNNKAVINDTKSLTKKQNTYAREINTDDYIYSGDGKTYIDGENTPVDISGIASIKNGRMTLELSDGRTAELGDVVLGGETQAILYEGVLDMGVDAASAQAIVNSYDGNASLSPTAYIYGMRQAVEYGKIGAKAFLDTGAFTADLNPKQREMAYEIGKMTAENEAKREAERKQRASGNSEGRSSGGIRFDGITEKDLNETQRTTVSVFKQLFGGYGVTIEFFRSSVNEQGVHVGENGSYDPNTNTIRLDINAGAQGTDTILFTAAHELTHFIKQWSPEKFRVFGEFLLNSYAKRGVSIDDLIKEQQAKAKRNGRELDYEAAYEEVVADSCETFLRDSRLFDKLLNLKQQDKSLFEKTKEYISKLFDKVAALRHKYRNFNPDSKEGKTVTQMTDTIEQLHRLWEDAAMTALDNSRRATGENGLPRSEASRNDNGAQKNTAEKGGGIKLQAREYDANGNAYWRIESKKDIFNGLKTTAQYERAAREFLIKSRDNKTVIHAIDGKEMSFIRLSAEEFTNSEESKELKSNNPEMFNKKMRLIPSLEDLTLNANVNWQSPDLKNHKLFKERGFENFRGKLRIDNIIFNYIIRAGKAKFGDVFYDINLEVDQILPRTNNASGIKKSTSKSSIRNPDENVKQKQLEIIQQTNPMWDDYHTGIRTVADIHTWAEVLQLNDEREGQFVWGDFSRADAEKALKDGTITVYSSYPIKNGVFVSTSYIQAQEYAGGRNGKVYSKTIPLTDVAWINGDEGQYAEIGEAQKNTADGNSVVKFSERDYPIDADVAAIVNNSVSAKKDTSHILSTITAEQNKAINRLNNQSKNDLYRGKYTGGKHRFSDTMIKHALKEHGDFLREGLRAQLPITKNDIARHLSAIKDNKSPSRIKPSTTKEGFPSILTIYEVNGYTLYAEEITKSLGKNLPSDLIGHTMYKAPTLPTAAFGTTSVQTQPKRQSTVLCNYYISSKDNLSTDNFIADSNGSPALLNYIVQNGTAKRNASLSGLIALSSDKANFTDKTNYIEQGYVRCRKPFYITQDNKVFSNSETDVAAKLNELKVQGYDCFIFDYNIGDNYLVAVFNEAQIVKNTNGNVIPVSKKTDNTDDKTMRSDRDPAFVSEQGFRAENSLNNIEDEAVSKDNVAFSMPIGKRRRNIDKNVIELSKDNELSKKIGDLHGAVKYKVIQQYILDVIRGQKIVLSDGKVAVVDKSDAQHIARGAGDKKTTQISNIKKIIEKAVLVAEEDSTKKRKFDYFYYYGAAVKYDGEIFNIYLNVGRATNDKSYHLYDITQKLRDTAHRLNDVGRPPINKGCAVETVSLNDIIPKTANNVNNDYSTNTDIFDDEVRFSLKIKHANSTVEEIKDARNLTDEQAVEYLKQAKRGELRRETYIPIRKDTPSTIINTLGAVGIDVQNRSLIMQVRKAQQAMSATNNGSKSKKHGNNIRSHGMSAEQIVDIVKRLDNPTAMILQTNRYNQYGEELPDNVAVFVEYNNDGKEGVAIVEFDSSIDSEFIGTEFGDANYHTVVTIFEPDTERYGMPFDYIEELLANPDNYELEIVRRQPARSATGEKHPNTSSELPSSDIIFDDLENVNNINSTNTDNIEYERLNDKEQNYIQNICDKLGRAVVFEDLREMYYKGEIISPDGYIENGVIHLNTYAENPIGFVFKHELTHFAEKASGYAEFVRGVKNSNVYKKWLCGKMGESDVKIAEYKYKQMVANTHSDIYSASDPKAEAEMIADFVGEMLFTENGSGMASLVSDVEVKHRSKVVQFVLDLISYLKKKLSGMNSLTLELSILEDSFNRIVSEATDLENKGLYKYDNDISFCFVACTDQDRINAAEELERQGYNRLYIFKNCGLIRDAYGKWKYELNTREFKFYPDGNARTDSHYFNYKLQKPDGSFEGRLCDFVLFNSLFELYPQLKDITVIIKKADDTVRFIMDKNDENDKEPILFINKRLSDDFKSSRNNDIKSYILRELQRAIQHINGEYIGKSLTYWENKEKEGKTPYSEKLGRKLTAQEAHKYTADNYEAKIVETRRALRDTILKTDANKGRNLSNIDEAYLYSSSIERDMDILFDDNDNPFISKEYLLPSKDNSISDNNGGTTAENEVVPSLPDGTEENGGNSFEVALKKNQNSNELRRFLSAARMIDKNDIAQNLNIRAGSDSLISNVADNAKQAAEYFNQDRINELSQKILQRIDSIGRALSDSLLEKFKNTIFKNEKGQMSSLYTLKMRGVGGFEHSKLGLVAGTLEAAEQLYAQYNDGSPRNRDVYIQEIFVNMKNPLVLNYTPYEDSIRGIHDLVEREILFHSEFINLINQKNAAKEPTYSGLTTRKTREAIQNAGYDGIIYFNDSTDKGSMTVIVFDESQMITVAENGILQQNNGIMEDYFDLAAAEDAAKKVNNDKNIKLYTADSKYNKRKYRPIPDERIKAGNSGFMEKVTRGVVNAKRELEENLAGNNEIALSGKDTVGRTFGKKITGECDKTFFKDKNGTLLSFFAYGKKIIDLEKAIKSRTFFGTLNSAINDLVLSKEKSPRSLFGVIQEFYINSVAPLVVELDNLDVEAIAKQIFEEKIITEKEYYRIISPERKNPTLVLINKLDEKGFDCIVFAKQTGECAVLPFDASQVFPAADNGIVKENSNVTQVDEIEEYNENYRIDRVVIEREGETPIDTQEIRNILTTEHDNTIKMKLVTKVLMCNNNPAIDYSDNRTAGHSGILEKNKVNILNARAIVTALINRDFSDISIADTDTAGRIVSERKRQFLRESKFVDKDGRPLSVFGFNRYGHNRFKHSQFGLRVSTLNAAHDISLFPKENPLANARGSFEEYYPIVKNPYFLMFDPENLTPAMLAEYLLEEGTITNKQYEGVLVRLGADRTAYHSGASNYLTRILKEKGFDSLAFMNERADPGSIGLIVFDKSQLIPVAIDGLLVENSDRTLADSDNEPAFFMPENDNENFVEKGDENEIDSLEDNGYNENVKQLAIENLTKDILKNKPKYSPNPKKWLNRGGKITVDEYNVWTYINSDGVSVKYINGYPDYKSAGLVVQEVDIGEFKNRKHDANKANALAPNGPRGNDNVWHHSEDGKTLQEISNKIHKQFTHQGGICKMKGIKKYGF